VANKVEPAPNLPNVSRLDTDQIKNIVLAATRILIAHATRLNLALVLDGTERMTAPLMLASYATGDLPAATADNEGSIVYDTTTNTVKFSNGAVWANI